MKKLLLILFTISLAQGCSSVKQNQKALNKGNYDTVINNSLKKLQSNKNSKRKQPLILMLEQAFENAVQRDLDYIKFAVLENNPANYEGIYKTYKKLANRQQRITPILPLYHVTENRNAQFDFKSYDAKILEYQKKLAAYLYQKANQSLLERLSKNEYRSIYRDLQYLNRISPNYKDVNKLMDDVHFKGTNFIIVSLKNTSNTIIPKKLELDLLDFSTYGLNDFWTVYHNTPQRELDYDFVVVVEFREILLSPERIKEFEAKREKEVIDGWEYVMDENGEHMLDEEGEYLIRDKYIKAQCLYNEFIQQKAVNVSGVVTFKNIQNRQTTDIIPLGSEFIFEHHYARILGDIRALNDSERSYLKNKPLPFPSNEQLVFDAGQDLKNELKSILSNHSF
ncbi:hypothetical protein [Aquimarina intermedia]|uniref:Lipoprotein n=1 Tax=Aquimarina intermedia TaxID=350814 RepID=A0A5S5BYI8_9FLAO|nr:hypothetical protein [Aquimarina intermedia]TYP72235.1 hypothetical protein BD809_107120 [Aquimarina intermedia]